MTPAYRRATPPYESVWPDMEQRLERFLASHGVAGVRLELAAGPPTPDPRSGELRQVIRG